MNVYAWTMTGYMEFVAIKDVEYKSQYLKPAFLSLRRYNISKQTDSGKCPFVCKTEYVDSNPYMGSHFKLNGYFLLSKI